MLKSLRRLLATQTRLDLLELQKHHADLMSQHRILRIKLGIFQGRPVTDRDVESLHVTRVVKREQEVTEILSWK